MRVAAPLILALAAAGSVVAAGTVASAPPRKATTVAARDWTRTIVTTAEGGYRMGSPNAPVKLVEYASYSCPHCAEFAREATAPLLGHVRRGQVSWEFRPFLLFPTDPGIAMLVRCQGASSSFRLANQIFAEQDRWIPQLQALPEERLTQLQALPMEQRIPAITKAAGLDAFFRERGMPDARIKGCLADRKALDRLLAITSRGSETFNVRGTPTFFVNGSIVPDARNWETLEPALRRALQ